MATRADMTEPPPRSSRQVAVAVAVVAAGLIILLGALLLARRNGDSNSAGTRRPLTGFSTTHVTVTRRGSSLEWCLLLAATEVQRERGLMQVTDPSLGGFDGMLFRFDADTDVAFYMRNTPMPLSIAFVAADGHVVSTADMAPCEDRDGCPLYPPAAPYRIAIEVPQGGLPRLGIDPGARVVDDHRGCA